ncbi:MAG: ornithine cyclodeaminase [Rhodobacteraceae bacterium]|nr:ornithine cyclodeaminase [Paracoccaceae bacterium]
MSLPFIEAGQVEPLLDWLELTRALEAGHSTATPELGDGFLYRGSDTLLARTAWIDGMGLAVKAATVFPGNAARGLPAVNGAMLLFDDSTGRPEAVLDFHLVTKWKTAGDSLLAALRLARPDSGEILIIGAGTVAASLIEAYGAGFPQARFTLWNRNPARARALADRHPGVGVADDLPAAVARADIICCATMATEPVLHGAWLRPGQHVDLIGAFRPDMREADDQALRRARIFVDARATTLAHIGELKIPLQEGVIAPSDVVADFADLSSGRFARRDAAEITLFKNGGGAHLDLMTGRYIVSRWQSHFNI